MRPLSKLINLNNPNLVLFVGKALVGNDVVNQLSKFNQGRSVILVDDTLKIIACREQHKKLSALEMELAAARHEGFTSMHSIEINGTDYKRRSQVVIGIFTTFGRKNNRDAIHKAWMGTGKTPHLESLLFLDIPQKVTGNS
ncbi:hypothetical protein L3X38_005730 [Prunus dulcis]|uniref:Hexosyltransferase n=1 Tax=Prunus dulcis TaxID=3755 RepID=A0AAD4ZRB5_PRUDU|nr:hypothetical protein L3X38_005730 [Prunus dulcis]